MEKKRLLTLIGSICLSLVLLVGLLVGACAKPAPAPAPAPTPAPTPAPKPAPAPTAEKIYKWVVQSDGLATAITQEQLILMSKRIEQMSNGRFVLEMHAGGELVPYAEVAKAVRDGVVDLTVDSPYFELSTIGDKAMLLGASGMPGGPTADEYVAWFYQGKGMELSAEVYKDYGYVIGVQELTGELFMHSNKEIKSAADFKGLKFRTAGLWGDFVTEFGASVVYLPGGEVYSAMQRGIIDAFEYGPPYINYRQGFHEVAKYIGVPGVHAPSSASQYIVNKSKWDALPSDLKDLLQYQIKVSTFDTLQAMTYEDAVAIENFKKKGTTFYTISDEFQQQIVNRSKKWAQDNAAKDPLFKKIWDSQVDFITKWRSVTRVVQSRYSMYD